MKNVKSHKAKIKNILSPGSNLKDRFIPDYKILKEIVDDLKRMGYRIVLTQGVFDLIHEGHAEYLEKAVSHGEILIVGVDTDALTKKRKGPNRPVVPQAERIKMLSHLRHVSILTFREDGDDIGKLIKTVCPHTLITSKTTTDFTREDTKVYNKYCEEIITLPPQSATSTTARIRLVSVGGADRLAKELMEGVPKLVRDTLDRMKKS